MSKGNGKLNAGAAPPEGENSDFEPIDLQEGKMVKMNIAQFLQGILQTVQMIGEHQAYHCQQIADLAAEVEAMKKGLSEKPETVKVDTYHG